MSKTIKVEDKVYDGLETFRDKRETFSEAVERLLSVAGELYLVADILEGQAKFKEFQGERLKELASDKR